MNITNLVTALQLAASNATTTINYMMLSKMIEKLNVGSVTTVATSSNLPSTLTTNGNVYYVVSEEEHFYNIGADWKALSGIYNIAYAWGRNAGELGDNTTSSRLSPVTVVGNLLKWISIAAGGERSLGIVEPGIAYAWGDNSSGALGDGTTTNRSSPVTVVGNITNWIQISTNATLLGNHTLGLTSTGIAYAWGENSRGQLGDNTTSRRSSPVTVVGGITNWVDISAGGRHSLGVTSSGVAYAWGYNNFGQLGDNTMVSRRSPINVVGGITNWSQLSAGGDTFSLGLTSSGIAYAWGRNLTGELGDNTALGRSSPVTVVGGITNWSMVNAARGAGGTGVGLHSVGITLTGIAYAWGYNNRGQLGDNTIIARSSPVTVVGGTTNWVDISAGSLHTVGLTSTGIAYAWGDNGQGRLGDNTTVSKRSPVTVVGGITNWAFVAAGAFHSLAIQSFTG